MNTWVTCGLCGVQQDEGALFKLFVTCLNCSTEIQKDGGKDAQKERLSFLQQYDPSPLSNDFKGDISFVVKGTADCVQAHKFILMSKSPVLKAMLKIDMKETLSGIIQIEGMSATVVRAAVNFMYTGEIAFSGQVLPKHVLKFSHQYKIQFLKTLCEEELVKKLTSRNFGKMFRLSERFEARMLKDRAREWFAEHPNDHMTMLESAFNRKRKRH